MSKRGFTLIEVVIGSFLISILLLILIRITRVMFSGTQKGSESLNTLQAQSIFLTYLKHDLRTLIFSNTAGIPAPEIKNDMRGTLSFTFFKVESVDTLGRPLPVKVEYQKVDDGNTYQHQNGAQIPVFGISRKVGASANAKIFVKDLIATFSMDFLDRQNNILNDTTMKDLQKARLTLNSGVNELFEVVVSVYSPYLEKSERGPPTTWHSNYSIKPFSPMAVLRTYEGVELEPEDYEIISGTKGIALLDEW